MAFDNDRPDSGFALLGLVPSQPSESATAALDPSAPLTRRQARELENRSAPEVVAAVPVAVTPPAPIVFEAIRASQPDVRQPDFPMRSAIATSPLRKRSTAKRSKAKRETVKREIRQGKATTRPVGRRPRSSAGSRVLSFGAMLFAGALLVGMSVPANAFMSDDYMVPGNVAVLAGTASSDNSEKLPGQTLAVADDVAISAPSRDGYEVISYAQVLALKYANISYSYTVTSGAVRWPFPYAVPITDGFGERVGGFHKGVDFVPGVGTPIYAIADGTVKHAGEDYTGYGNNVIIEHTIADQNIESLSAHMQSGSSPIVTGQQVKVGDFLGLVGDTGLSYGAHLHFEIHVNGVPVDPFAWLQANAIN